MKLLFIGNPNHPELNALRALKSVQVAVESSLDRALQPLAAAQCPVVLFSSSSCGCSDEHALKELLRAAPQRPVIVHHRAGTIDDAIRLTQLGACYILLGELDPPRLEHALEKASERMQQENSPELQDLPWRRFLIGQSASMLQICEIIQLIAAKRCTVLITGETGTGKEVVARAIHAASNRASLPMIAVNCTALPANLIESELFGHAKGAFTGAHAQRIGRFEQAHRSTIFLDEIGDLPLEAQAKLLRVLQEQEFQRVGSSETVRVDVRVVAASNVDLESAIQERRFREDLYYRLNVVPVHIPPLRDRREDIPLLVNHFLAKISQAESVPPKQIASDALEYLTTLQWPGNVRQLEHTLQMAFALSGNRPTLHKSDFALHRQRQQPASAQDVAPSPLVTVPQDGIDFDEAVRQFQLSLLNQALVASQGNKARAANLLRIKRTTLLAKMKSLEEPAESHSVASAS